jgi:phenylacetic acid degradation operon negative regulatory protein
MPLSAPVAALLDQFHDRRPLRAWSLIVTLYGDAIVPRGGSLWLGSLIDIMALFRIDAGHVRTAMSRLSADGWLDREKIGRNSYYRLSRTGEGSFVEATRRIYFTDRRRENGHLRLALLGPGVEDRATVRPALEKAGFAALSPTVYVAARAASVALDGVFLVTIPADDAARGIAAAAWKLPPIAAAYRGFIARYTPLAEGNRAPKGDDALVARTLLIHDFRRIVLRDPALPAALLPAEWPEPEARALAARIYRQVAPAADRYLDGQALNEAGPLPPPDTAFAERFREL